jgi:hypothetical protein
LLDGDGELDIPEVSEVTTEVTEESEPMPENFTPGRTTTVRGPLTPESDSGQENGEEQQG